MGIDLRSWVLVSLMNDPIPFAYATECLTVMSPDSKSTSHQRRAQTSPMRIPVCRASTTARLNRESGIMEQMELSFGTRSDLSALRGFPKIRGASATVERVFPNCVVAALDEDGIEALSQFKRLVERVGGQSQAQFSAQTMH